MRWTSEHSIWFWTPTLRMIWTREVNFQEVSCYNAHLRMYFCVSSHIIIFSVCNKLINRRNLSSVSFDPAGKVWNARIDSRISSLGTSISCKWSSKSPSSISIEGIQLKANCRHILSYCWKANCVSTHPKRQHQQGCFRSEEGHRSPLGKSPCHRFRHRAYQPWSVIRMRSCKLRLTQVGP
jgi:hypothetical protein